MEKLLLVVLQMCGFTVSRVRRGSILYLLILLTPVYASAQSITFTATFSPAPTPTPAPTTFTIPQDTVFKVKLVSKVSSATARDYDYVEFQVMEDILSSDSSKEVLIAKETSAFGLVTQSKHRHFPGIGGKLKVFLKEVKAVDGSIVNVNISRFDPCKVIGVYPGLKCPDDTSQAKPSCKSPKNRPFSSEPCVSGRRNATVAPVVPAVAGAGAVLADDATAKALAILTLLSNETVGDLLNGVDAELGEGEIFDARVTQRASVTPPPKDN